MKKANKFLGTALVCLFALSYSACDNPAGKLPAVGTERSIAENLGEHSEQLTAFTAGIEKLSQEMFGNVRIGSEEILYNLDDSPDFIYVEFTDSGYAVFAADSLELLEHAAQGSLPYQNTQARRYYNGPQRYLTKVDEQFVNEVTNVSYAISVDEAKTYSQAIRQTFSISEKEIKVEPEENNVELIARAVALPGRNNPPEEGTGFINGTNAFNVTYINNSNYFIASDPMH